MKRFSIILLGALAIMMAGCSKDVHTASNNSGNDWVYNEELPVPIQFGIGGGPATKATGTAITDIESLKADIDAGLGTISVFALDKSAEAWNQSDQSAVYLNNVSAKLGDITTRDDGIKTAELTFNNGPYYYPLISTSNYSFYSYYARVSDNIVTYEDGKVYVNVNLGQSDLLYAKAEAELIDGFQGYNARYIRKVVSTGKALLPTFNYQHATASIDFSVQKECADPANPKTNQTITINRVTVFDLLQTARLCVADIKGIQDGKLVEDGSEVADIRLKGTGSLGVVAELDVLKPMGTMFIFPQKAEDEGGYQNELSGEMALVIKNTTTNKEAHQTIPFKFNLNDLQARNPENGFEAGHRYNVKFTVYEAEDIKINVTVSDYEETFDYDYVIE